MMKKVGIVIPSFNSTRTIVDTLDSIENQDFELTQISFLYLADDRSKDNTTSLATSHWNGPIPLCVRVAESNLGQWENLNRAIELVGEEVDWVLLLHSDDIAKPNWLANMSSRIKNCSENIGSICSSWDNLLQDGTVLPGEDSDQMPIEVIIGNSQSVIGTVRRGCWWHISGCAIRVSTFKDVGEFDASFPSLGDLEWLLRCLNKGWSIEYIPKTLILYRQHSSSISSISLRHDRDIKESLKIIRHYSYLLRKRDIILFHLRCCYFAIRRFGRSLIQLNIRRFPLSMVSFFLISLNFVECLQKRK